ncbi:sulfatase-like hydrolase/transferase [Aurantiacibacter poecillastricola]|uniref:sulfatase-like hydrolase/transferase n=1 Tax=Aurantiacibacter poecillastricola TaxID=3064385 RepID=UPI00273D1C75|nr:sulfatase-like hydrolase/transferase [Aurantiacibacter sp. 219JJ12-13]MDP5262933.1 sulfatase-like hydrolase/transferase [Aurantiacibacter sp. 219JJ12-13]
MPTRPVAAQAQPNAETDRPNVIVILADDVGVEAFRSYGGEHDTPNIDRLVREGVTFEHAFSTPLCSPSRTRLMTGMENAKNYEAFGYLGPDERTFGNVFSDAGYSTGIVGKWQLSGNGFDGRTGITPTQAGFGQSLLWQLEPGPQKGSRYWGPTLWRDGSWLIPEEGFGPDYLSDYALSFLDEHAGSPFLLYYPMVLVHNPFVPTPAERVGGDEQYNFGAMMRYMDRMVGRLLDRLDALGLAENTLVIFTADNGTNRRIYSQRNGETIRGGKGQPTLTGTHVPLMMRWPGHIPAGERRSGLFDFADVLPTIAAAASLPVSPEVDGVSQLAVAQGRAATARDTIFQHYAPMWRWPSTRFVFDTQRKLYDDGRYVALDLSIGEETALDRQSLSADDRERLARFEAILAADTAPLEEIRYPWCEGEEPSVAGADPLKVGCGTAPGNRAD